MLDAIGIVNFEARNAEIKGLSQFRTIPAMSFLGRYRVIDFVLSNMVNSGIDHIKVMINDKPRSLIEHIGSGTEYNINPKHGYLQLLYPDTMAVSDAYFHDVYLMRENLRDFEKDHHKYIVISPSYMICCLDYQKVIEEHEKSGADITAVYANVKNADEAFTGCQSLTLDANGRVTDILPNLGNARKSAILMETYVLRRELFCSLLEQAPSISPLFSFVDILRSVVRGFDIRGYEYKGYLSCINSLEAYYEANMELIDHKRAEKLFKDGWPIYTKTNDSPPANYRKHASVKKCIVANGCEIDGELENCILGRGVVVEKGARIKNSLILPNTFVCEGADLNYVILDKHARVVEKKKLIGKEDKLIYIKRSDRV